MAEEALIVTVRTIQSLAKELETLTCQTLSLINTNGAESGTMPMSIVTDFIYLAQKICRATEHLLQIRSYMQWTKCSNVSAPQNLVHQPVPLRYTSASIEPSNVISKGVEKRPAEQSIEPIIAKRRKSGTESKNNVTKTPANVVGRKRGRKPIDKSNLVCQECGKTETPEWRRGPKGKNTLCNACGVAWMKLMKKESAKMDNIALTVSPSHVELPIRPAVWQSETANNVTGQFPLTIPLPSQHTNQFISKNTATSKSKSDLLFILN